jgi:hypothetical protein
MSTFQHPHLTRGVIQTPHGAFVVSRGRVEMPDEIGESLGWRPVDRDPLQAAAGVPDGVGRPTNAGGREH